MRRTFGIPAGKPIPPEILKSLIDGIEDGIALPASKPEMPVPSDYRQYK